MHQNYVTDLPFQNMETGNALLVIFPPMCGSKLASGRYSSDQEQLWPGDVTEDTVTQ